jgi:hypothetical protein
MHDDDRSRANYGARFIAFLLIAGGILGILAAVALTAAFMRQHRPYRAVTAIASVAVFGWGAIKGIDLWRGRPQGYRWAKILFALQIPAFSVAGFSYEFSTGISYRIMFGNSNRRFGADIGSSFNLLFSPETEGWMLGVNCIAVAVLAYLMWATRSKPQSRA